ncbi:MAG: chemotaxis protein CheC [Nitrospiraceae bacterium]|nr:MAG: chemotaxis protein CheC [Nitrospiraceae bacterium]
METHEEQIFTSEELEILQEIMNIAFGKSAADLADVIDTHVVLNVPFIDIMQVTDLPSYILNYVKDYRNISIVEQNFWGRFKGDALLVFSSGSGKELITMLQHGENTSLESDPIEILERETLMEVGNIIIGACVGKLAELLKDVVTYTPPMIILERFYNDAISENHFDPDKTAIVLKTDFSFTEGNVSGFLFLITSNDSIQWMKEALRVFIAQYE